MKQIKLRAWVNKDGGYMAFQGDPDLETLKSFIFHYGECELMEWTGLIDVNGKDVFDGDILVCHWIDAIGQQRKSFKNVCWCDKRLQWCINLGDIIVPIVEYFDGKNIEVAENIYGH